METIARNLIEKAYGATNLMCEMSNLLDDKHLFLDFDTGRRFLVRRCEKRGQYVLQELLAGDPKYYSFKAAEDDIPI